MFDKTSLGTSAAGRLIGVKVVGGARRAVLPESLQRTGAVADTIAPNGGGHR